MKRIGVVLLIILLPSLLLLSLMIGATHIPPAVVIEALLRGPPGLTSTPTEADAGIVWDFRLSRALLALAVGAGLGIAGAGFQGLFRNPLADPFVIGASGGAALGGTLGIVLGFQSPLLGMTAVPAASFVGAIGAVAVVYGISRTAAGEPAMLTLLLAGTAVSSLCSGLVSFIMAIGDRDVFQVFFWLLGGFAGRGWADLLSTLPYIVVGGLAIVFLSRPLDLLGLGDDQAQSLGLDVARIRGLVLLAASLVTAGAVAAGGIIGFVGLVAPHVARLLVGPLHRRLVPASAAVGGILVLLADDAARVVLAPRELPAGVLTAFIGAPFFLYLLKTRSRSAGSGW